MTETAKLRLIHRSENQVFYDAEVILPDGSSARLPLTGAELRMKPHAAGEYTITLYSKHVEIVSSDVHKRSNDYQPGADQPAEEPFEDRVGPYAPCEICKTTWRMRCGRLGCV